MNKAVHETRFLPSHVSCCPSAALQSLTFFLYATPCPCYPLPTMPFFFACSYLLASHTGRVLCHRPVYLGHGSYLPRYIGSTGVPPLACCWCQTCSGAVVCSSALTPQPTAPATCPCHLPAPACHWCRTRPLPLPCAPWPWPAPAASLPAASAVWQAGPPWWPSRWSGSPGSLGSCHPCCCKGQVWAGACGKGQGRQV